jgi:hypothetical protein
MLKYVREKIDLMKRRQAAGKLKSPAGYLNAAIRKNYENPEASMEAQQSDRKRQAKERGQAQRRRDNLVYERDNLGIDRDHALHDVSKAILQERPEDLDTAIAELSNSQAGFRKLLEPNKTALQNYERPMIFISVNKWLEEKYPECFAAVRADFKKREADLDQQIAALSVKTAA